MILFEKKNVSIKSRVLLTLGITLVLFILGYFIFFLILNKKNHLTQVIQKHELIESIDAVLQTKLDAYEKMVFDYSVFSWMIDFIKHPSREEGELTISHPQNVGISFVQIYNLSKTLVYRDLSPTLKDTIGIPPAIFDSLYNDRKFDFFLVTKYGLMQLFGSTVHTSDDTKRLGNPKGFVIFGKLWDANYLEMLRKITNCNITLVLNDDKKPHNNNNNNAGEFFFTDYQYNRIAHLDILKNNPFFENMKVINNYFDVFFISFCLMLFLIIYFTYNLLVIKPLNNIETALSAESTDTIKKYLSKNDEFGKIAKLIGWFFVQRDELRNKVEELKIAHKSLHKLNTELSSQKKEIEDQNSKLHSLNTEMQAQNEEIVTIAEGLDLANNEITESISYASFIQNAVLAPSHEFSSIFPEHFIVYEPKNIVSGDFYWFKEMKDGKRLLAVADCTGHGLSGSLLSMLGISFLNQITSQLENKDFDAAMILDTLKNFFIQALHQDNGLDNIQDGMHIALCIFDKEYKSFQYATAYHTICLVRLNSQTGAELIEYKGNHIPVGIHPTDEMFTNHEVKLQKGDSIYMSSDGFPDQFGGAFNKKYKPSKMRNFLISIAHVPFVDQKERVKMEFVNWKGNYEQTDDVIVVGIKIPL